MQELFDEVKRLAKEKGMSLTELERAAGLGYGTVHKWESRDPKLSGIQKVAKALDTDGMRLLRIAIGEID